MNGKDYLLDTNIVIGLFANESSITEKIKSLSGSVSIPSIVIGELFYGAEQSSRREENKKKIEALAEASLVLECDTDTARLYGKIKSHLKLRVLPYLKMIYGLQRWRNNIFKAVVNVKTNILFCLLK